MFYDDRDSHEFIAMTSRVFSTPIDQSFFEDGSLPERFQWFDKEGFELTELEGEYAKAERLPLTRKAFGHRAIGWSWIENSDISHPDIYVDHSYLVYRPEFVGGARVQIERYTKRYPFLVKLLQIQSKTGLDIALEYVTEALTTEVLHLEIDDRNSQKVWLEMRQIQMLVKHKEWPKVIETIKTLQPHIERLPSDDQSDLKARLFGYQRTYSTLKTV